MCSLNAFLFVSDDMQSVKRDESRLAWPDLALDRIALAGAALGQGYMYGCTAEICEAMGMCTCSIEETDLDSSGLSMMQVSREGQRTRARIRERKGKDSRLCNGRSQDSASSWET